MSSDEIYRTRTNRKIGVVFTAVALFTALLMDACASGRNVRTVSTLEHRDGVTNLHALALRFAPRLYLHPDEPFEITEIIPVFHPVKPIVAYHIFFEDDALFAGRGKEVDHEIVWVEYDPVTLKVSNVATLWHRTVLRTDKCLIDAKASEQRPRVEVQWGQHGLLPLGWETLQTVRPRVELVVHYNLVRILQRIPRIQAVEPSVRFKGSYREYLRFTREVDAVNYVKNQEIIVAEYTAEELKSRVKQSFGVKKEWPFWSAAD